MYIFLFSFVVFEIFHGILGVRTLIREAWFKVWLFRIVFAFVILLKNKFLKTNFIVEIILTDSITVFLEIFFHYISLQSSLKVDQRMKKFSQKNVCFLKILCFHNFFDNFCSNNYGSSVQRIILVL